MTLGMFSRGEFWPFNDCCVFTKEFFKKSYVRRAACHGALSCINIVPFPNDKLFFLYHVGRKSVKKKFLQRSSPSNSKGSSYVSWWMIPGQNIIPLTLCWRTISSWETVDCASYGYRLYFNHLDLWESPCIHPWIIRCQSSLSCYFLPTFVFFDDEHFSKEV